jgi:cytochrome c-type biogenesis protein CcmH/NrfG
MWCWAALIAASVFDEASAAYARADAKRVIAIYRQTPPVEARDYALLGKALFQEREFAKAAESFAKAVEKEPQRSEHHLWLGRATGRRAERASPFTAPRLAIETRKHFERAVDLDPNNVDALSDLFEYYLSAPGFLGGGESKAAALLPRIRALNPQHASSLEAALARKRQN